MKKIVKIKGSKEFLVEEMWSLYLFSYIFIFLNKNNLYDDEATEVTIDSKLLSEFKRSVLDSLNNILEACYKEPSINDLQKHSSRFERLKLGDRIFKVNYRMSITGRLSFAIYSLISFIEQEELKGNSLVIESR